MLTPPQVARRLGVAADKVRAWIRSGELPAMDVSLRHGLGRPRWRVTESDLDAFIRRRSAEPRRAPSRRPKPIVLDCPDYSAMLLRGERVF